MSQPHISPRVRRRWRLKIDVSVPFHDEDLSLEDKTKVIDKIIRQSGWIEMKTGEEESDDFVALLEELLIYAEENDRDLWNVVWNQIYDHADEDRVWLNVWPMFAPTKKETKTSTSTPKPSSGASSDTSRSRHPSGADPSSSSPSKS